MKIPGQLSVEINSAGGIMYLGGAGALGAAGGLAGAVRAGTAMGSAASTAYGIGQEGSGAPTMSAGLGGVATAAGNAARSRVSAALGLGDAAKRGRQAAFNAMAGKAPGTTSSDSAEMPTWAREMKARQTHRHHSQTAMHAMQQGDRGGHGATPDIKERED